ncbi:Abi-like protein [Salinivirga cyanobacteriivorans]|uniref:Abi-like protein n=1 Tax=Salinivirga cyanobacteriivorans TaxID=1307839 RepID=A0A0S2HVK9_9BACT|nr:Abi family protein [Salinivirga cyanobacteriivorans]ALO14081.1 Abi-like protein [Salinivirga cyanobacteriivorans]
MDRKTIERIFSPDRLAPYLRKHDNNFDKAIEHYKANIEVSETFYPLLAILEVGLRNQMDYQLQRKFNTDSWYDNNDFIKIVSRFQIDRITDARNSILREKKIVTSGKVISELSFGFWTSLLDSKFERTLWKKLRLAFPNCPKTIRQRKTMSSKFNGIRKLRNRIFHHEPVTWNIDVIRNYRDEIIEAIDWLDKGLLDWSNDIIRIDEVIDKRQSIIK